MKRKLLIIFLGLMIITSAFTPSDAKNNSDVTNAIKLYKNGNYTECYQSLTKSIKKDSTNALAYYYLAMSAIQVGKSDEAIANYNKAIALSTPNSNLYRYAVKGKTCAEDPEKCMTASLYSSEEEEFILSKFGPKVSDEVKGEFERLKIEQMMREMNRSKDIDPRKFKEYKDFSSMNNVPNTPNNDEIVAALKTLQNAGLTNVLSNSISNNYSDLSLITDTTMPQHNLFNMMNNQALSPQVIQMMLTNNMSSGF